MKVGTEQEWRAARKELVAAERELEEHAERVAKQRQELPWVPVENEYTFATEDGPGSTDSEPTSNRPRRSDDEPGPRGRTSDRRHP